MNAAKLIWSLLFRIFPCPTALGLRAIGHPDGDSPVLVTCNFYGTVRGITRFLEREGVDAWLLVAESRGVNVWCAAGGDEFNTRSVVSAVKTSGVADMVEHRRLLLPPLGAPGIDAAEVKRQTGWSVSWGPVRYEDIPRFLARGARRDEAMKRATYTLRERLDTALGSLFPFYLAGALGFLILGRGLLLDYLLIGAASFLAFFSVCPWLPGRSGLSKVLWLEAPLGAALLAAWLLWPEPRVLADVVIAMVTLPVFAAELGGLASTMPSDLDPFLSRLGIGAIGNVALAGTIRTELLNGYRKLTHDPERCTSCRRCGEVCPVMAWDIDDDKRVVLARPESCVACRACLVQCDTGGVEAPR